MFANGRLDCLNSLRLWKRFHKNFLCIEVAKHAMFWMHSYTIHNNSRCCVLDSSVSANEWRRCMEDRKLKKSIKPSYLFITAFAVNQWRQLTHAVTSAPCKRWRYVFPTPCVVWSSVNRNFSSRPSNLHVALYVLPHPFLLPTIDFLNTSGLFNNIFMLYILANHMCFDDYLHSGELSVDWCIRPKRCPSLRFDIYYNETGQRNDKSPWTIVCRHVLWYKV